MLFEDVVGVGFPLLLLLLLPLLLPLQLLMDHFTSVKASVDSSIDDLVATSDVTYSVASGLRHISFIMLVLPCFKAGFISNYWT